MIDTIGRLPGFLKTVAVSTGARVMARRKYGEQFRHHFEFLSRSSSEERSRRADEQQRQFLARLRKVSRFYDVPPDLDITRMPIIDKSVLLSNYDKILLDDPIFVGKTSGTTGQPVKIPYSADAYQREYAFWWYHRGFGGVRRGDRIATMAGHPIVSADRHRPPFWVHNTYENQLIFSSYHLSRANLAAYVDRLNRFRPRFIHGYPSSLFFVANGILESGLVLDFKPTMASTASETLLDFQRQAIEAAFRCRVSSWYGNAEFAGHAEECPEGRLHLQPYHSTVRIVDDEGRDVAPGETGTIVATTFSNTSCPLINYNTYDVATLSADQRCSCSMGGTLIDDVQGRIEDYVVTSDGRHVGRLDHLFKDARHVRAAQIVQRQIGEIVIRVERAPAYDVSVERTIAEEGLRRLGRSTMIRFEYVDEIPRLANGKLEFIVQELGSARVGRRPATSETL